MNAFVVPASHAEGVRGAGTQYTQVVRPALQSRVQCLLDPRMRGDDKRECVTSRDKVK